jgi:predicted GTPase
VIFVNQKDGVTENYRRYLYNGFRAALGLPGHATAAEVPEP